MDYLSNVVKLLLGEAELRSRGTKNKTTKLLTFSVLSSINSTYFTGQLKIDENLIINKNNKEKSTKDRECLKKKKSL